ncbi:MAG: ribokinase [Thermomicrobiales bacterium]
MSKHHGRVLVAGSINTDLVGRFQRAPEAGETVTGSTFQVFGGGKGANQAVSAARSGAEVAMLGAVGNDDFGRQRLDDLMVDGVDVTDVDVTTEAPSGVALITVEEATGQNRIGYIPGATMTLGPASAVDAVERFQPVVVLATLELPEDARDAAFAAARNQGALVVVNATPEAEGVRGHLPFVDALVVNETEAADLLGYPVDPENAAEGPRALGLHGPRIVLITLGAAGALLLSDGDTLQIPAPEVEVVDTTGAGDATVGAFGARLAVGDDAVSAARAGVVAGSLACTRPGAQPSMPTAAEIDAMLARM